MLLLNYITLILKQLVRLRMALFFTLLFPVTLYLFYGHNNGAVLLAFLNFAMQSAMLQTVGIFTSVHKHTSWGQYLSTLPAPPIYAALGTIFAMFVIGLTGILIISSIDFIFFHTMSLEELLFAAFAASIGAIPTGALGYLIGARLDQSSARNALVLINMVFLFMTFVPAYIQKILAMFLLPNTWLTFSFELVTEKYFNFYAFSILILYFLIFLGIIQILNLPEKKYRE